MIPIVTPATLKEIENNWDIHDTTKRVEAAAEGFFLELVRLIEPSSKLLFLIGKGLNGSDGLALALKAVEAGLSVEVMCFYPKNELKETSLHFYKQLEAYSVIHPLKIPTSGSYVIVDAIFGAGFKDALPKEFIPYFKAVNQLPFVKISLDIPSGINGETGEGSHAIKAHKTLSIGLPKWGCFVKEGRMHAGHVIHIPLPYFANVSEEKTLGYFLAPEALAEFFYEESSTFHKYERGQVIGLASHPSFQGASALYTYAAYRTGAGIVRLLFEEGAPFFTTLAPEVTQHYLKELSAFIEKPKTAFIVGPGLKADAKQREALSFILQKNLPCVIDGGAFEILGHEHLHDNVILTPHLEELRRLLKKEKASFTELLNECGSLVNGGTTCILKGHHTWIIQKNRKPVISSLGPTSMATAGSGDVLAGILGAFLAKGYAPFEASILGVCLHGLAGQMAGQTRSKYAILASDIIESVPDVYTAYL